MKKIVCIICVLFCALCSGCVPVPVEGKENTPITPVPIITEQTEQSISGEENTLITPPLPEQTEQPISQEPDSSLPVSSTPHSSQVVPLAEPEQPPSDIPDCRLTQHGSTKKEVSVKGHSLQFVKINSGMIDNMALTEEQATVFYRKAFQMLPSNLPVPPFIFKAVSDDKIPKVVTEFWIQVVPVNPKLYGEIVPFKPGLDDEMVRDGALYKISYRDAREFIEELNKLCEGEAAFDLPTEKQFVYLAKSIYDPVQSGELQHCNTLTNLSTNNGVKKLLGYRWQLTKSKCEEFSMSSDPTRECNDKMYVKKGGTATSKSATECIPEYRAEASPRIRQPNTTFRLILKR